MFTCDYILYSIYKVNNMIIKIDNRETTLIPLIEKRFEISEDDLQQYSRKEILKLFDQKQVDNVEIINRNKIFYFC